MQGTERLMQMGLSVRVHIRVFGDTYKKIRRAALFLWP